MYVLMKNATFAYEKIKIIIKLTDIAKFGGIQMEFVAIPCKIIVMKFLLQRVQRCT